LKSFWSKNRWWLTRTAALPFQLLLFSIVAFLLVRTVPGDPILTITGDQVTPEKYLQMKHALGLDGSLFEQLFRYIGDVTSFNLGDSLITGRSVSKEFRLRLPATLELAIMGMACTLIISIISAYLLASRPRMLLSRIIRSYANIGGALPDFALGVGALFVFYATLHWAPAPLGRVSVSITQPKMVTGFPLLDTFLTGNVPAAKSMIGHLVLPVMVMVAAQAGSVIKILSASLDSSMTAPATLFRIASGASRRTVMVSVFRRALPPTVTMCGYLFGYQLGGAVVLEALFSFGGMGQYIVAAVKSGDITAMRSFLVVVAAISLLVFLLVDLVNMSLDPRRRPGVRVEA
jgi:ABC-type dipeptide/oligopeptide/nickel transport system permease component